MYTIDGTPQKGNNIQFIGTEGPLGFQLTSGLLYITVT